MANMGNEVYPVRMDVDWEEFSPGNVVIIVNKDLSRFEERVADFLRAPKTVRRTLDEMNSKLWLLMDGGMSVNQIVVEMDRIFSEKIAPASERVSRSIADFVNMGLVTLDRNIPETELE